MFNDTARYIHLFIYIFICLFIDFFVSTDENECVNHYEKLQLEFCPDGGSAPNQSSAAMRHSIGLGAFGGWSEPLQPQQPPVGNAGSSATQSWCSSALGDDAPQPPGTRSPPDGQNDDGQQSATCSQHLSSLFPQPASLQSQPQQLPPLSISTEASGSRIQPGLSQQPLWPVMANSTVNVFSQPPVPDISSERSVDGYRAETARSTASTCPSLPPDYSKPDVQDIGAAGGSNADENKQDLRSGLTDDPPQSVRGLDVITSRPLDVVPSCVPPESRVVSGHEGRHPDIIDVWQSGMDGISSSPPQEATPPRVSVMANVGAIRAGSCS